MRLPVALCVWAFAVPSSADPLTCSEKTCAELGSGWTNFASNGDLNICGESDAAPLSGCSGQLDFAAALIFCEDVGARLCSVDEVLNREAADSGCGYDYEIIWTSTSCGTNSYYTAYGDKEQAGSTSATSCESSTSTKYARCCADMNPCPTPAPSVVPVPAPTPAPSPLPTMEAITRVSSSEVASPLVRTEVLHATQIFLRGELLDGGGGSRRQLLGEGDDGNDEAAQVAVTRSVLDAALGAQAAAFDARLLALEEAHRAEVAALRAAVDQLSADSTSSKAQRPQ